MVPERLKKRHADTRYCLRFQPRVSCTIIVAKNRPDYKRTTIGYDVVKGSYAIVVAKNRPDYKKDRYDVGLRK